MIQKFTLLTLILLAFTGLGTAQSKNTTCGLHLHVTQSSQDGMPVQNPAATVTKANGKAARATLLEAMPVFRDLRPGKYKITVTKAGYKTTVKNIVLDCTGVEPDDPSVTEYIVMNKGTRKQVFTMGPAAPSTAGFKAPDELVKSLFKVHKDGAGPFFQTKNRAIVDRYFARDVADRIWNDAVTSKGEVGAISFDPLYGSQDLEITGLKFGEIGWGGEQKFGDDTNATVQVYFKNHGKDEMTAFILKQQPGMMWKIVDIRYPEGHMLTTILSDNAAGQ